MYTGVPLVFLTGSHSSVMELRVSFVTLGMTGVGGFEPSPLSTDENVFKWLRNLQLAPQLFELF